jgi:sugar-specific transcriptional regulator TrmB
MEYKKEKHREMKRQKDMDPGSMNLSSLAKKPKVESTNGEKTSYSAAMRSTLSEAVSADHIMIVENYKEQVSNLKKQLGEKDRIILEKEKKIGELQGDLWQKEKEFRVKLQQAQKENVSEVESLQSTIRDLRRQMSQSVKSSRSTGKSKLSSRVTESAETGEKEADLSIPQKNQSPSEESGPHPETV